MRIDITFDPIKRKKIKAFKSHFSLMDREVFYLSFFVLCQSNFQL